MVGLYLHSPIRLHGMVLKETQGKLKVTPFWSTYTFPLLVKMLLPKGAAISPSL
jgi:hypothetical protein